MHCKTIIQTVIESNESDLNYHNERVNRINKWKSDMEEIAGVLDNAGFALAHTVNSRKVAIFLNTFSFPALTSEESLRVRIELLKLFPHITTFEKRFNSGSGGWYWFTTCGRCAFQIENASPADECQPTRTEHQYFSWSCNQKINQTQTSGG